MRWALLPIRLTTSPGSPCAGAFSRPEEPVSDVPSPDTDDQPDPVEGDQPAEVEGGEDDSPDDEDGDDD